MLTSERPVSRAMGRGNPRSDVIVVRAAPTGVTGAAANGTQGVTIHSLLRLPIGTKMAELNSHDIAALQNRPSGLRCLIIDEKSIISLKTLALIDGRLRQALPDGQGRVSGGISIILMGDFYQLPPVKGKPLVLRRTAQRRSEEEKAPRNVYMSFEHAVELLRVQRQHREEQEANQSALDGLCENSPSAQQWRLLCTRVEALLPEEDVSRFANALHIYPTNESVGEGLKSLTN